jgi:signal transduction histidine kinase
MSSKIAEPRIRSAAWQISLWATVAFACGTMLVFVFLHNFVAHDIQRRSDAWLSGELGVLGDVARRTPKNALYGRVVREVAELASREIPNKLLSGGLNDSVFFLQAGADGSLALWVGAGDGSANLTAVRESRMTPDTPSDLHVKGFATPFRVASARMEDGSQLYLGLSEKDELRVLRNLRLRFFFLWLLVVLLGFAIVFYSTRRMLGHVREIAEAASRIGKSDLSSRVPTAGRKDEVAHLAFTLNHMLDRIERTVHQLHTITDTLAHDLRSPLTAIRAKLEISLAADTRGGEVESIVSAIDELDRLTEILNKSLDVAEARADALRLDRVPIDLDELLRVMIELYEPCMSEKGLRIQLCSAGSLEISADAALLHRMIANLFDNELKHLPSSCTVTISLRAANHAAFIVLEDDGPGFNSEISPHMFEPRVKGQSSDGHGLGLAFVEAVVRAHGGAVTAANRKQGGVRLSIVWPFQTLEEVESSYYSSLDGCLVLPDVPEIRS